MKVLILVSPDFDDSTTIPLANKLSEEGIECVYATVQPGSVTGAQGETVDADQNLVMVRSSQFDALVISGGAQADQIRHHPYVPEIIRDFFNVRKPIAAINEGVGCIIGANLIRSRKVSNIPALETELKNAGAKVQDQPVYVDKFLVTMGDSSALEEFIEDVLDLIKGD